MNSSDKGVSGYSCCSHLSLRGNGFGAITERMVRFLINRRKWFFRSFTAFIFQNLLENEHWGRGKDNHINSRFSSVKVMNPKIGFFFVVVVYLFVILMKKLK